MARRKTSKANSQPYRRYTREEIERLTLDLFETFVRELGCPPLSRFSPTVREIYEAVIYPKFELGFHTGVNLENEEDEQTPLGATLPKDRLVLIDKAISPPNVDARYTFTVGHEFGHGVLHCSNRPLFRDSVRSIANTENDPLENEANWFAIGLFMPKPLVRHVFQACYGQARPIIYKGPGEYWFDRFGVAQKMFVSTYNEFRWAVALPLTRFFFGVSKQALGFRLNALGLVQSTYGAETGESHISTILGDIMGEI